MVRKRWQALGVGQGEVTEAADTHLAFWSEGKHLCTLRVPAGAPVPRVGESFYRSLEDTEHVVRSVVWQWSGQWGPNPVATSDGPCWHVVLYVDPVGTPTGG